MSHAPSENQKRSVLIRGIYEEARCRRAPETAYALFHDLGVSREEVHSYLGYVISDYYQIFVSDLLRAANKAKVDAPKQVRAS